MSCFPKVLTHRRTSRIALCLGTGQPGDLLYPGQQLSVLYRRTVRDHAGGGLHLSGREYLRPA